jgi:hypothetical protein
MWGYGLGEVTGDGLSSASGCELVCGRRAGKWSTETMLEFVVGNTDPGCGKLKNWKGFLKPNFGLGPN